MVVQDAAGSPRRSRPSRWPAASAPGTSAGRRPGRRTPAGSAAACGAGPWARGRGRTSTARRPTRSGSRWVSPATASADDQPDVVDPARRPGCSPGSGRWRAGRPRRPARCTPGGPGPSAPATHRAGPDLHDQRAPTGRTASVQVQLARRGAPTSRSPSRGTSSTNAVAVLLPGPALRRPHPGCCGGRRRPPPGDERLPVSRGRGKSVMTDANLAVPIRAAQFPVYRDTAPSPGTSWVRAGFRVDRETAAGGGGGCEPGQLETSLPENRAQASSQKVPAYTAAVISPRSTLSVAIGSRRKSPNAGPPVGQQPRVQPGQLGDLVADEHHHVDQDHGDGGADRLLGQGRDEQPDGAQRGRAGRSGRGRLSSSRQSPSAIDVWRAGQQGHVPAAEQGQRP